jgi:transposase
MTGYPVPLQDGVPVTWVAIDIAKGRARGARRVRRPRRQFRVANRLEELQALVTYLRAQPQPLGVAFEPTGVYHRVLAYQLVTAGVDVVLVASPACARYREARYTPGIRTTRRTRVSFSSSSSRGLRCGTSTHSSPGGTIRRKLRKPIGM